MMINLDEVLNTFFNSDNKVAVIKGDWGIGKTHFWNGYYHKNVNSLNKSAYSYISLFGKNSINEIKKEIFHLATPINEKKYRQTLVEQDRIVNGKFLSKICYCLKYNRLSKFIIKYFDNTSIGFRAGNFVSAVEYSFVKDYVICFDDLERKGNSLEIKDIMGLIDELARKKNCKIILVYNENNLKGTKEEKQFSEYREKIVDLDIMFSPMTIDNLDKVFFKNDKNYKYLKEIVLHLDIKNIRILIKIKNMLAEYEKDLCEAHEQVRADFVNRVALFSFVYYSGVHDVDYEEFKTLINTNAYYIPDDEVDNKTPVHLFVGNVEDVFNRCDGVFDDDIDFHLKHGYKIAASNLGEVIQKKNKDYTNITLNNKVNDVWAIYTGSFAKNDFVFISEIKKLFEENLCDLPLGRVSSLMEMLESLGEDCDDYITKYTDAFFERCDINLAYSDLIDANINFEKLSTVIKNRIVALKYEGVSLEDILIKLSAGNSYNPRDVDALNNFSEDDYFNWMTTCERDVMNLVKNGLLKFDNLTNPTSEQEQITRKAKDALVRISKLSSLNEFRVRYIIKTI
ncbi:hypothetical protein PVO17_003781 [Salmonella enterica]|uniref:KAP NTPase domain-containing protein n=1 Tax=Citrobacter portucalensis TaxID=1639133 RepID=A0AAW9ESW5_9ENTR|nr:P-loop NTPase fold protein [Citrobacter portucalensis]EKM7994234.1 hypothetical protein [Salmonella enterica]MDX7150030.1 hypothetical protein [Citrobacter portucalensis]